MNIAQIEQNLQNLIQNYNKETFIFDLLLAYGSPKASITRLQKGNLNLSKEEGVLSWKKKVLFKPVVDEDLHLAITTCKEQAKQEQRFIIVTNFKTLLALDTKTADTLDIEFNDLPKHFDFFLPWAGMEKAQHQNENPADVKAAEKMAKLFDEIKKDNPDNSPEFTHGLNVFLSRLLFCYFAEDTGIFKLGQFTNAIASHTQIDGSDLSDYLDKLFDVLNTPRANSKKVSGVELPAYLLDFPYVNGGLFKTKEQIPVFTRRSRQAVIDAGQMDWSAINPDIFGSMFQAVISPEHRGGLGAHYTSVPNIMKVIEPLFLNDLKVEFGNSMGNLKKLNELLGRIQKIKIFDPACGSGNFLIIAYKELRRLEISILAEIQNIKGTAGSGSLDFGSSYHSVISLNNFYGIEIDDFAYEIAKLALWLAEHQMNREFYTAFGSTTPTLPLKDAGQITCGNATRLDWEIVCPKKEDDEIYILGNPPYLGSNTQNYSQKEDMSLVFKGFVNYKKLDYITAWFIKGANYIQNHNAQFAFVSTNSICQGEQVALLWPTIFDKNLEICFAHTSFKWNNNAKANAGVTVIIVGIRNNSKSGKFIFSESRKLIASNINAYLANAKDLIVKKETKPLSEFPIMMKGSQPADDGNLLLSPAEKNQLLLDFPELKILVRPFIGAKEYIRGEDRYCIWITDENLSFANKFEPIQQRLVRVSLSRNKSTKLSTIELGKVPHKFTEIRFFEKPAIIVPTISSERREYIPAGFVDEDTIVSNTAQAIYDYEFYIFSIISSRMQLLWVKSIGGKFKTDYIFSSSICYNTFPFPKISESQKQELTQCVFRILEERENHSEKTLAQLYDPEKMPEGLREAHRLNDLAVERCYRSEPFESDEERLEYLFKLYEKMIAKEKGKEASSKAEKKTKKQK